MTLPLLKNPEPYGDTMEIVREAEVSQIRIPLHVTGGVTISALCGRVDLEGLRMESRRDVEAVIEELQRRADEVWGC